MKLLQLAFHNDIRRQPLSFSKLRENRTHHFRLGTWKTGPCDTVDRFDRRGAFALAHNASNRIV